MRMSTLTALSTDPTARNLGPIQVTRQDPNDPTNTRTYYSRGGYFDPCPDTEPALKFRFMVTVGYEHYIQPTDLLPDQTLWQFWSSDPTESVLMQVFMQQPYVTHLLMGPLDSAVQVQEDINNTPVITDPAGTNQLDPQGTLRVFHHTFVFDSDVCLFKLQPAASTSL